MTVRTPSKRSVAPRATKREAAKQATEADEDALNEVRLIGRVAAHPVSRVLPSGDSLITFRVIVDRPPGGRSSRTVDALECSAWTARVRRTVSRWRPGDVVEVQGAVRRRFFRGPGGAASRVEVEVAAAKLRRRPRGA